jgi:zinc-binding alcohol dehydrogenase/oxidoreductase
MRAAVLHRLGDISELKDNLLVEDFPAPEITGNEVLIRIKAAALNHRDLWITKGLYSKIKLPVILGSDCAGVIEKCGPNVSALKPGDEVIVDPSLNWGESEEHQSAAYKILGLPDNGTLGEFVKVPSSNVYPKPSHLDFEQAAGLPLVGITAYRAAVLKADIKEGDNVLIPGIGGGVAVMAMLYCLALKANVYVTSGSNEKINKAISLGAKAGFNYNDADWADKVKEVTGGKLDAVIDGSGGETISKSLDIISYGGKIVSYGATNGGVDNFDLRRVFWKQIKIFGSTMGSPRDFKDMLSFVEKHNIVPVIDDIYELDKVVDAFGKMDNSAQFGKIVLKTT